MKTHIQLIEELLGTAGITINGSKPFDIKVNHDGFYDRILSGGSLAVGESYMDGWWGCPALDQFIDRVYRTRLDEKIRSHLSLIAAGIKARLMNLQNPMRALKVGKQHYDAGNDLYAAMLDRRMVYSCAYWKKASDLDAAQEAKLDLICRKIGLKEGMRVLDIGCGWGGFAKFAAERYGARVTGVTISKNQAALAREICRGLPVEIRLQDYRKVGQQFDRVVSIGMIEHVGYKNYECYMDTTAQNLSDGGIAFIQTIGGNKSNRFTDPWISRYIFPNSMLPSIAQLGKAMEGRFVMEDWHNLGTDYDRTLMAWFINFNQNWPLLEKKYGSRFYRMWRFYLLSCAGLFRARFIQLWQIAMTRTGAPRPDGCRI